jgi:RND family efflux transporter MFP subunit
MEQNKLDKLQSLSIDRSTARDVPASMWPLLITALVAALIAAVLTWWIMQQKVSSARAEMESIQEQAREKERQSSTAGTQVVRASGMVASGYVVARRQATVSAEITGVIREILFEEGTRVEKDQILARLDDTRSRIALDQGLAAVESSRRQMESLQARIVEARIVLDRARTLAEKAIGSEAAVTAASAALKSLQAQLAGARANLAASQANVVSQRDLIERHIVRAPFAGVVIAKNAQVGEILSPASAGGGFTRTGIATMVDMQSLEIEVDVNEGQIERVSPGQKVEAVLDAYQDWRIKAHVIAIIPTADRARATIKVRVAFDTLDGRVLPDMAAKVTFIE